MVIRLLIDPIILPLAIFLLTVSQLPKNQMAQKIAEDKDGDWNMTIRIIYGLV
jgi:hypothetical protein